MQPATEILIAELADAGFEGFVETEKGLEAYISSSNWVNSILDTIYILTSEEFKITYEHRDIPNTNWNAIWEKNFKPIIVDNLVCIRAPFHDKPNTKFDIVIEPKMSFGTGHHETTFMMVQQMLINNFEGKFVLDMGCGTGVLAILAEILGAKSIDAIDVNKWCYVNSLENIERNKCTQIKVYQGNALLLSNNRYDVILANINRNTLLADIPLYSKCLNPSGQVFISGFFKTDIPEILAKCNKHLLRLEGTIESGDWVCLKFVTLHNGCKRKNS